MATLGALVDARLVMGLQGGEAVAVSFLTLAFAQLWHVSNIRGQRGDTILFCVGDAGVMHRHYHGGAYAVIYAAVKL